MTKNTNCNQLESQSPAGVSIFPASSSPTSKLMKKANQMIPKALPKSGSGKMQAIVYYGKSNIRYEPEFAEPQINKPDDVKLKVLYTSICGSDLKEFLVGDIFMKPEGNKISGFKSKYGCVLGHEISARVIEVGSEVRKFKPGDFVVVEVTGTCHDKHRFGDSSPNKNEDYCEACKAGHYNACKYLTLTGLGFQHGGLAEFVVTGEHKLIKYDDSKIPPDVAALIQPIAVSWHAVRISNFQKGQCALIIGGGPIGLTTLFALKGHQCGKVVISEPAKARRELALELGAEVYDPTGKSLEQCVEDLKKMSPTGTGFNRSYDCSGFPITFRTSVKSLTVRGVATNIAMWAHKQVDYEPMHVTFNEKLVTGSICFVKKDFEESVRAFEQGLIPIHEVRRLITSKVALRFGVEKGFMELIHHKDKHVKILFSAYDELVD